MADTPIRTGRPLNAPTLRVQPSLVRSSGRFARSKDKNVRLPCKRDNTGFLDKFVNFLTSTRKSYREWKRASQDRSYSKATEAVKAGLSDLDFKKVYQNFMRLHELYAKKPECGTNGGNASFVKDLSCNLMESAIAGDDGLHSSLSKCINEYDIESRVDRYSGRNTLFHRMLEGLDRAKLVPRDYIKTRNAEIEARHNQNKDDLRSFQTILKDEYPKRMVVRGEYCQKRADAMQDQEKATSLHKDAALWFKRAALTGDRKGMLKLADCLDSGRGVAVNHHQAFIWRNNAGESGIPNG